MLNKLVLIVGFLFVVLSCSASVYEYKTGAKELMKELPVLDNIECTFKQEKILKNIQKPLISGGNFKFDKTKGVFFETTYPIKSYTSYTGSDYSRINDIIVAISNKQYSKLDNTFDLYYKKNTQFWTLGLKPKEKTEIYKYINTITIDGTEYINKIVIEMKDGSKTTQWFSKG